MKRFDLGMSINYCPTWGVVESLTDLHTLRWQVSRAQWHHLRSLKLKCSLSLTGCISFCLKKLSGIARTLAGTFGHPYIVRFTGSTGSPGVQLDTLFCYYAAIPKLFGIVRFCCLSVIFIFSMHSSCKILKLSQFCMQRFLSVCL